MTVAIPFLIVALLGNFETVNYTEGERKESSVSVEAESVCESEDGGGS